MQTPGLGHALSAYAAASERSDGPATPAAPAGSTFAAMLAETLEDAVETGYRGENAAIRATTGATDLQSLVEAVNAADLSLQSVVAVRDRIISAYQDIIRMPI